MISRLIIGIGSHDSKAWEVPSSAICNLENQEKQGIETQNKESWSLRAEEDGQKMDTTSQVQTALPSHFGERGPI